MLPYCLVTVAFQGSWILRFLNLWLFRSVHLVRPCHFATGSELFFSGFAAIEDYDPVELAAWGGLGWGFLGVFCFFFCVLVLFVLVFFPVRVVRFYLSNFPTGGGGFWGNPRTS